MGSSLAEIIPDSNQDPIENIQAHPPVFEIYHLDMQNIIDYMKDLLPSSSCGMDGITARLLKAAGPSIFPIILLICNLSIATRVFPDC